MDVSESTLDGVALGRACALLHPLVDRERLWPALAFAYAMVMASPTFSRHVVQIDLTIAAAKSL